MEILDRPNEYNPLHWSARYAKWMEIVFFGIYVIGSLMQLAALPYYVIPVYIGTLGWLLTYAIVYPLWVVKIIDSISKTQASMFVLAFGSLALYVLSLMVGKMTYYPTLSIERLILLHDIIEVLKIISTIGIVTTCFYCLFVWHRIGKKEPQAYQFAFILWPRLFFLVAIFVMAYTVIGIKL